MKNIIGANAVKLAGYLVPPSEANAKKILKNNSQFLADTFTAWYNKEKAKAAKQSVEIISPKDIDWDGRKDDKDESKFGEYTINPETISIDWENIPPGKIKTFDFAEFVGRPKYELAKHIAENYADKYHIPGIEYWKYLYENKDKVPQELRDGNYFYLFGSILRVWDGVWKVPYSGWDGWYFRRWGCCGAARLKGVWPSNNRVILLEK